MYKKLIQQFALGLLIAWGITPGLRAQCTAVTYEVLAGNKTSVRINSGAEAFWNLVDAPAYEVPRGSGRNTMFASSVWIGGLDSTGALHQAASTYRQSGLDYYSGPYRQSGAYNCGIAFSTPTDAPDHGMLILGSGKLLTVYNGGFIVYDPQTQTSISRTLPSDYEMVEAMELPDGDVLMMSWRPSSLTASLAIVWDTAGFPMPPIDTLIHGNRYPATTLLQNNKVFIASPSFWEIYDPQTGTDFVPASPPVSPGIYSAVITLPSGKVLMVGGTVTEIYDPLLDSWSVGPNLSTSRNNAELTLLPTGEVLVTGGSNTVAASDLYNPTTNTISAGPSLPYPMRYHTVTMAGNQELLVTEGDPGNGKNDIYFLNYLTGATRQLTNPTVTLPIAYNGTTLVAGLTNAKDYVLVDPINGDIRGQRWQKVWKVTRAQVQQFQLDFANQTLNFANYPDIKTWPGNGNVFEGEDAQLAPYRDLDNDGAYDPLNDGDYPCFPGDIAAWWVYNDDGVHSESGGTPLKVQVKNLAYAFDCSVSPCPDTTLDYATFYHVELSNHGDLDLHDLYMGMWHDMDLGNYTDDYVGSDSSLGLGFVYNGDANDETSTGYGLNPPAFGSLILPNGQVGGMNGMMSYDNDFSPRGNPQTADDYYHYITNRWKDGSHLVNNGLNGMPATAAGPNTNYIYSGDPGFCGGGQVGWSEASAGNTPFDRRLLQNIGPLTFTKGVPIAVDYALLYSRAYVTDNLGSVCKLKADAATVKAWWQGTLDRSCLSLVMSSPQAQAGAPLGSQVYPNPNGGDFTLSLAAALPHAAPVTLQNLQGQMVWSGTLLAGQSELKVGTHDLPSGLYMLRLAHGNHSTTHKVVIAH